jgi:hypothetical protein
VTEKTPELRRKKAHSITGSAGTTMSPCSATADCAKSHSRKFLTAATGGNTNPSFSPVLEYSINTGTVLDMGIPRRDRDQVIVFVRRPWLQNYDEH